MPSPHDYLLGLKMFYQHHPLISVFLLILGFPEFELLLLIGLAVTMIVGVK